MYSLALVFILQYFLNELHCLSEDDIEKEKEALRYGFHQTHACEKFEKAFKCIRKCLDEKFDVAYADKNCACTCYYKKEKEKYRYLALKGKGKTPPTTKIPAWALPAQPIQEDEPEVQDKSPEIVAMAGPNTTTLATTLVGNDTNGTGDGNTTLDANEADGPAEGAEGEGEEGKGEGEGEGEGENPPEEEAAEEK